MNERDKNIQELEDRLKQVGADQNKAADELRKTLRVVQNCWQVFPDPLLDHAQAVIDAQDVGNELYEEYMDLLRSRWKD